MIKSILYQRFGRFVFITLLLMVGNCSAETNDKEIKPISSISYELVNRYAHNRSHYTQGLTFYNHHLYESTGQYGESKLIKYSLDKLADKGLSPIITKDIPKRYFAEGISIADDTIWMLTWRQQQLFKLSAGSLALDDKPIKYNGQGWGLAHADKHIIRSDGSHLLTIHDVDSFTEKYKVAVTYNGRYLDKLNELEWFELIDGQSLLIANRWYDNRIYFIDVNFPSSAVQTNAEVARVVAVIDLTALKAEQPNTAEVLNGIAWHPQRKTLWVTGKYWSQFYELKLHESFIQTITDSN